MKNHSDKIELNRIILPLAFIFFSLLLEVTNFLLIGFKTSSGAPQIFPSEWLFDLGAMIAIAGLIFIVKNKYATSIIFVLFLTVQLALNTVNANIYVVFGDMFTTDYLRLGREAAAAISWEFIDFASIAIYLSFFAVIVAFVVILYKFNKKEVSLRRVSSVCFSLVGLLLFETVGVSMYSNQLVEVTNADSQTIAGNESFLYESFQFKTEAYKTFGYYGFYAKNFIDAIFGKSISGKDSSSELMQYLEDGKTQKSDLDARFENDNLIVILCESHEWFAYDPINTPFVWDLITAGSAGGGFSQYDATTFSSFYAHNKTNISEGIVQAGDIPQPYPLATYVDQFGYDNPYTLPKLFKAAHSDENVVANYFHSWQRSFYNRDKTYLNEGIGFDNFYSVDDYSKYDSKFFGDWICDSDFIKEFGDKFVPSKEDADVFLSFFATITTHGAYTYENPRYADLYEKYDNNFEAYSAWLKDYTSEVAIPQDKDDLQQFRRYKVGAMEFDRTIQTIFNLLEEKGRLEDTTVVMFADHNAYYDNLTFKTKGVNKADFSNVKVHNIPLIIYNSKLEAKNYDFFCNTYDVFPTICELHGLEYNKNMTQGYNLFSDEIQDSFFASHLGGMWNGEFFSKNITDAIAFEEDFDNESLQHFKDCAEKFYQKQQKIEQIYLQNLAK